MAERWSIIAHGGARAISKEDQAANREGCRNAVAIGAQILRSGGSALDAVLHTVKTLEDDPTFNAGCSAVPNADGDHELDAAVMDGTTLNIGAVAALRQVRNPVMVARLLVEELPVLLVGEGARAFAVRKGIAMSETLRAFPPDACPGKQHDTVGCVALDTHGRMAVATSTGGLTDQCAGRVGDAPLAACGFYVDDKIGGVAISGDGESIIRLALASRVMQEMEDSAPAPAVRAALRHMRRVTGEAGIIALDKNGRFGVAHNSPQFTVAMANDQITQPRAGVEVVEFQDVFDDQ
jgi:beta-aspartyl-peptidase (threonine type)